MRFFESIRKALLPLLVLSVGLTACATGRTIEESDSAMAMIRVQNDTPVQYVTVSLESMDGNLVSLGNVSTGDTETFYMPVDAEMGEYQLIAETPSTVSTPDVIVSASFITEEGMTVNWYLEENELEVN